jgi:pimeloyl-ACP methyl ester carboxylesterase
MAHFILVHGTFAQGADWPLLQAGLTETAQAVGESATFVQVHWTGKNRARARASAASSISLRIKAMLAASPTEKIFVIGHSHGGSAIAYLLKQFPETAINLAGCAFLSTPFVAIRGRINAVDSFTALALFVCLMPVFACYLIPNKSDHPEIFDWSTCLAICFGSAIWLLREKFLKARVGLIQENAIREQTADLPEANCLFIRASGDEAAAALSATQFVAWASSKGYALVERITIWLLGHLAGWIGTTLALGLFAVVLAWGFLLLRMLFRFPLNLGEPEQLLVFVIVAALEIVPAILFAFVLETYFVLGAQAIMARSFGWGGLWAGLLTELAIEPLPFGEHSLVHIDWNAANLSSPDSILHSWTYSHPLAIEHIKKWVVSTLKGDGAQVGSETSRGSLEGS